MTTASCCAPTLVSAVTPLPVSLPMLRAASVAGSGVLRAARPSAISLHRPAWSSAWLALSEAWAAWRAASRHQAELRALAMLDRHLLRDVGLDECLPRTPVPSWQMVERARW